MNSDINKTADCYVGYYENNPVCFFAVLHFPHAQVKNFKKGHRLVVLPDYQGLGIGHKFCSRIAQLYLEKDFRFIITSSTKALMYQRAKDPRWIITRKGRTGESEGMLKGSTSNRKMTYSYEYIGETKEETEVEVKPILNEVALGEEIKKTWGEFGWHYEVYKELLKRAKQKESETTT